MRVWFVSAYDQPRGHSSRTYDYARYLVERGHKVVFFTNSFCHFSGKQKRELTSGSFCEDIDGIQIVWLKTPRYGGNGFGRGLNMLINYKRILEEGTNADLEDPEVVIGPSVPILTGFAAYQIAKRHSVPFVFEIRDVWPAALVMMGALSRWNPVYLIFRIIEKVLYDRSDQIFSALPFVGDHISESIGRAKDFQLIPNPVDLALYGPPCPTKSARNTGHYKISYIGGFGEDHDVFMILRGAKLLMERSDERFTFDFFGTGAKLQRCKSFAKQNSLKNVRFHDPVDKSEIARLQCESDILVAAITDSDSYKFGLNLNKLGGYLASGRPVILSGNPPNDPITDSGSWFTVPAGDETGLIKSLEAIASLSVDELETRALVARGYTERELSIAVLGERMESALANLISADFVEGK